MKSILIAAFAVFLNLGATFLPGHTLYQKTPAPALPVPLVVQYQPMPTVELLPVSAQDYVQAEAAKYGWGEGAQWQALTTLINNESGWRPYIVNGMGACGLFQALPCSKLSAPTDDVANQARWGLAYIKASYSTPSNALATWYSRCGSKQGCWY